MESVVTSSQITIIDVNDAPSLNAWISATNTTSQTYNGTTKTWSPDYTQTGQVLKLNLTKAGSSGSLLGGAISEVKWFKTIGTTQTEITSTVTTVAEYKSGNSSEILTVNLNVPNDNHEVVYSVEGIWTDPATDLPVQFASSISILLIHLAKASLIANVYAPKGDFFRNNSPVSLEVHADLYKDGAISSDSKKIKWFAMDTSIMVSQDADAGVGWRKISATTGVTKEKANIGFDGATNGSGVLTVFPDGVVNAQTYLVVLTDNTSGTDNSGDKVKQYITLRDMDDPIMTVIESSAGTVFKNGTGSTILTAILYRNGEMHDSEDSNGYVYKWTKWENNTLVNFVGTTSSSKMGKSIPVSKEDVNIMTVFKVEVSK